MKAPDLPTLAKHYLADRVVTKAHCDNVMRAANACRTMTVEAINTYLRARLAKVHAATVKHERTILLSIWRHAYDTSIVDTAPRGIVRFKVTRKPTQAWTADEIRHSLAVAAQAAGQLRSGVPLGPYLECWLRLGYESGARLGDVRSFRHDQIVGDTLRWTQHKTGDPITKVLSPQCLASISRLKAYSTDGTIIGFACGKRMALRHMKSHLDRCGLAGSSKWLRRSGATHIEMLHPGKARLHLGHRSVGLAERNYLDWGQIRATTPVVPPLEASQ